MDEGFVTVTPSPSGNSADVKICSPDKAGFGCDLARTMFDFGLTVERGDFSTDGKWSFLMFKVLFSAHVPVHAARLRVLEVHIVQRTWQASNAYNHLAEARLSLYRSDQLSLASARTYSGRF